MRALTPVLLFTGTGCAGKGGRFTMFIFTDQIPFRSFGLSRSGPHPPVFCDRSELVCGLDGLTLGDAEQTT